MDNTTFGQKVGVHLFLAVTFYIPFTLGTLDWLGIINL